MLWNLINKFIYEFGWEILGLLLIQPEDEGEEDVGKINIELGLLSLWSFQTNRHRLKISQHKLDRIIHKWLYLWTLHLLLVEVEERSKDQLDNVQIIRHS